MRRIVALFAALLAALFAGPLAAAQTITWLTSDLPPQYIAEGELAGFGIKDQPLGRAMIARLDALQGDTALWQQWMEPLRRWLDPADFAAALAVQP